MSIFESVPPYWSDRMLSVLRIVAGIVLVSAGTMKLFGFPPPPAAPAGMPGVAPWEMPLAGVLETFAGAAIVLGFLTRPLAFLLSGEMAVAYFQVHARMGMFPMTNGGAPAVLLSFTLLYLVFAGAGAWSLDALIARSQHDRTVRRRAVRRPSTGLAGLHYDL